MCAIFGYTALEMGLNSALADVNFASIRIKAKHRGRDDGSELSAYYHHKPIRMGWCRATPTTEPVGNCTQPFCHGEYSVFHNGTIANDRELGNPAGTVDSAIIPAVLSEHGLEGLNRLKGSYALAIANSEKGLILACNYKPLYYVERDGFLYYASMEWMLSPVLSGRHIAPVKLEPYSALLVHQQQRMSLLNPPERTDKVLVVCSGGLDSTVAAAHYQHLQCDVTLLHFTYGCLATEREVAKMHELANHFGCKLMVVALPKEGVANSALTNGERKIASSIEGAEYAYEWVPARNFQMLAVACGIAEANGFNVVAYGANLEEAGAYPDNEEELVWLLNKAMPNVVSDGYSLRIEAPLGHLMKHEIVRYGLSINAPFHLTWSCYKDGEEPCHDCGPCFMREEAFRRNNSTDPLA